jgi:excisionase family DNA binding protein
MKQSVSSNSGMQPASQILLTPEEAAAYLKLAPKTIRALCNSRRISAIRICRRWRIPAEELDRFTQAHLIRAI